LCFALILFQQNDVKKQKCRIESPKSGENRRVKINDRGFCKKSKQSEKKMSGTSQKTKNNVPRFRASDYADRILVKSGSRKFDVMVNRFVLLLMMG
jgi:hypothetical protein